MSTPDNHGKKAPQFAAFKPMTADNRQRLSLRQRMFPARQLSLKTSPHPL